MGDGAGDDLGPTFPSVSAVAWSVGYYTVEGGKKIYGFICAPATGGPYPVVIYNHGGTDNTNGGNITGVVTAAGWTTQPANAPRPWPMSRLG